MMVEFFSNNAHWLSQLAGFGCGFLLQSTVLVVLGLVVARICRRFGAAVQSTVLRMTLLAILASPLVGSVYNLGVIDITLPEDGNPIHESHTGSWSPDERGYLNTISQPSYSLLEMDREVALSDLPLSVAMAEDGVSRGSEVLKSSFGDQSKVGSSAVHNSNFSDHDDLNRAELATTSASPAATFQWTYLYFSISSIWIVCTGWLLVRLTRNYLWGCKLCREASSVGTGLEEKCKVLANKMNVSSPPVLVNPEAQGPMLIGWIRPAIILPDQSQEMTSSQVLVHELAHVKRWDCFWNFLGRIGVACFFFQPFLWLLVSKLEEISESVCDDYVLDATENRQSYANQLIRIAESLHLVPTYSGVGIGMASVKSSLGKRVERIMDSSRQLSLRTGRWTSVAIGIVALVVLLGVGGIGVQPVSAAIGRDTNIILKDKQWKIQVDAQTLQMTATPAKGDQVELSAPLSELGPVKNLTKDSQKASWTFPKKGILVSLDLAAGNLNILFQAKEPREFTWPILSSTKPVRALIWPHWEGSYIPLDDMRWQDYLIDAGGWDTLEGLTMPFWGLDCGDYSLTWMIDNRYNNEIQFERAGNKLIMQFTHDFPPNHARREYGFRICLSDNTSPVEPARQFRQWLMERGEFVSMKEKMEKTPKVERLLGAAHVYLWGDAYLSKNNFRNPKNRWTKVWKPFTKQMIAESKSDHPTVGKHLKHLMGDKRWTELVVEMAKVPWDYQYLQTEICRELSNQLSQPDFFDEDSWRGIEIPDEAKALLAKDRSSLPVKDLARMNALLLRAAYPDYLLPVDQWGDGVSVAMLKQLQEAGFDRMRLCVDGKSGVEMRPEVAVEANKMGYLFGIYDSFHSIHDPKLAGTDESWDTAQFCQELYDKGGIVRRDGTIKKGFMGRGYNLSPIAARPYVEQRVNQNFERVPYNYYFVDCDAFGQVFDDYTPGREVTQEEDAMERNDRMKWITEKFDVVMGSEGGSSYSAPVIHIAEGMFISCFGWGDADLRDKESEYFEGKYYPPDGPGIFFKPTKLKEKYRYFHFDPRFRLPLFETVFHDSVIATNHWGRSNLKYPEEKNLVFLTQLLYQLPPLYNVNVDTFKKRKVVMKEQYDFFSPLHRELGFSQMTDFSWLTKDRLVQKTVFDDRVEMIGNFSEKEFTYQGKIVPAESVMACWKDSGESKVYTPKKSKG